MNSMLKFMCRDPGDTSSSFMLSSLLSVLKTVSKVDLFSLDR